MRKTWIIITIAILACSPESGSPPNESPLVTRILAPAVVGLSDTVKIYTYDADESTLQIEAKIFDGDGQVLSDVWKTNLHDDGLAGDMKASDGNYIGVIKSQTLLDHNSGFFELQVIVTEAKSGATDKQSVFIEQNPNRTHPPEVILVTAPDTVNPSLVSEFLITVTVSDPDGLGDIASVTRTTPSNLVLALRDDGVNGDATAHDGVYSERVSVNPSPPAGSYTFTFKATDRIGLQSAAIPKTIVIISN